MTVVQPPEFDVPIAPRLVWNTIGVPSVDEFLAKATAAGGSIAMPKMAIPGVGYIAYCKDPEGNTFGIMQSDPDSMNERLSP